MKKIFFILILLINSDIFTQINFNPKLYSSTDEWFTIIIPDGFTKIVDIKKKELIEKNNILFDKKFDPFYSIHLFNYDERLFIIKTYNNISPLNKETAFNSAREFASAFNEKMKKLNLNYKVNYENFKYEEKKSLQFFIFYGKSEWYLENSAFIQAVINLPEKRSIIILGFLKASEENLINNIFLQSIFSIEIKADIENQKSGVFDKKWFRYLIILIVAILITIFYNKYAKNRNINFINPSNNGDLDKK